jgi:hypothetical protein
MTKRRAGKLITRSMGINGKVKHVLGYMVHGIFCRLSCDYMTKRRAGKLITRSMGINGKVKHVLGYMVHGIFCRLSGAIKQGRNT